MSFQKTLLLGLGLGFGGALLLAGCGSSGSDATNGGTGGGSGAAAIDWASYAKGTTQPKFATDIMPILGFSCTASDCHNFRDKKAGLDLGPKCKYNATTKGCEYPATADSDPNQPLLQPLLPADIDRVYASLMDAASTVKSPTTKRVLANDPEHSFLMQKLADTQSDPGFKYTCENQDPSHETNPQPCGAYMPLTGVPFFQGTSRPKFDTLATWIAQGAQKN